MTIDNKIISLLAPVADGFAGSKNFTPVNMMHYGKCAFIIQAGVCTALGRANFRVEVIDGLGGDFAAHTGAVTCKVKTSTNSTYGDTSAAIVQVVVSGTNVSPVSFTNTVLVIEVNSADVAAAAAAAGFSAYAIRLCSDEVSDGAIVGAVVAELSEPSAPGKSGWFCSGIGYDLRIN